MNKQIVKIETMESNNRLRIEFMVGNYCNYSCWYCGPHANGGDTRWPSDYNHLMVNFKHLLDFYVQNGRNDFEINILGGEPSLWPNVARFARDIKSKYNAKLTMTTNGARTLRWWEENATVFDKILFSYHHKESDIDHFIKVLDLVYDKKIPLNSLVLMDPTCWDECVAALETMKSKSKRPWFVCAMEVHPPQYSNKQREIFKNSVKRWPPLLRMLKDEYENILKGKTTVNYNDGSKKKIARNFLSVNNLNHFAGWMCNIGIENINIQPDGKISGTCGNFVYGENIFYNLYDTDFVEKFNPLLVPSLCTASGCWCQPEMLMTKWKINDSKKIIPILSV